MSLPRRIKKGFPVVLLVLPPGGKRIRNVYLEEKKTERKGTAGRKEKTDEKEA